MLKLIGPISLVCVFVFAACDNGEDPTCQAGQTACAGTCTTLADDPNNCGACGNACGDGQGCVEGACQSLCGDLTLCTDTCVDVMTNTEHCGTCGHQCDPGQYCSLGSCSGGNCPTGETECSGSCVNLQADPDNCGACGEACDNLCYAGECVDTCPDGLSECDGSCFDLDKDTEHCGDCDTACDPGYACDGGECMLDCPDGFEACGDTCADLDSNVDHCGKCDSACDGTQVCDQGACADECTGGLTDCSRACVDTDSHPGHCGDCDNACDEGQGCAGGECGTFCSEGELECSGECVDVSTDPDNCGGCGTECRVDQGCSEGECVCPYNREECDSRCVDTRSNVEHCGECNNDCGDEACIDSVCSGDCPDGLTLCSGECVDVSSNSDHCGRCDFGCSADQTCVSGSCMASSVPGDTCLSTIDVTGGGVFTGSLAGAGADYMGSCDGRGRDVVFRYTLTESTDVFMNTYGSNFDTVLYVRDDCEDGEDIRCNDDSIHFTDEEDFYQSEINILSQRAGTYYVILDAWGVTARDYVFHIYFGETRWRGGDTCGEPYYFNIETTTMLEETTNPWIGWDAQDDTVLCSESSGGKDLVYYFIIRERTTVEFDTCSGTDFDTLLDIRTQCNNPASSVVCGDDECGLQSRVSATLDPGGYYLWIDGYNDDEDGSFDISVTASSGG